MQPITHSQPSHLTNSPLTQAQPSITPNSEYTELDETLSDICQLDGNTTLSSDSPSAAYPSKNTKLKQNALVAEQLPVVNVCNIRSLFPKIENFKNDFLERGIEVALLCEIWEKDQSEIHKQEIEKMLEIDGMSYLSCARNNGKRAGGVAIIVDSKKFYLEKMEIKIPSNLEVIWAYLKPKTRVHNKVYEKIVLCSFYSPPKMRKQQQNTLIEHIIGTLCKIQSQNPNIGILIGGDKNKMDISEILQSDEKLIQMNNCPTRKDQILEVVITNM